MKSARKKPRHHTTTKTWKFQQNSLQALANELRFRIADFLKNSLPNDPTQTYGTGAFEVFLRDFGRLLPWFKVHSVRVLYQLRQLAEEIPAAERSRFVDFPWSHLVGTSSLANPPERLELLRRAAVEKWTVKRLQAAVKIAIYPDGATRRDGDAIRNLGIAAEASPTQPPRPKREGGAR